MKTMILYPSDYFSMKKVNVDYEYEYREALRFPDFDIVFYHYDEFVSSGRLVLYPHHPEAGTCIYRGWMLKPEQYANLYQMLLEQGIRMINSPSEYRNCHEFPNIYEYIKDVTPGITVFGLDEPVDWAKVKARYSRFLIKDFVKSVKGTGFPSCFDSCCTDRQLDGYLARFKELRGNLLDGGIVIKEFVDLARVDKTTNEYRAFILEGRAVSVAANSNQGASRPRVPMEFVNRLTGLDSHFYTVDFAERADGTWIVIETGDGQVSGLSPDQDVFEFYEEIANCKKQ